MPPHDPSPLPRILRFHIAQTISDLIEAAEWATAARTAAGASATARLLAQAASLDRLSRGAAPAPLPQDLDGPDEGPPFVMPPPMTLEEWLAAFAPRPPRPPSP